LKSIETTKFIRVCFKKNKGKKKGNRVSIREFREVNMSYLTKFYLFVFNNCFFFF